MIDKRLLDCSTQAQTEENLNRILALIDGIDQRVSAVEDGQEGGTQTVSAGTGKAAASH